MKFIMAILLSLITSMLILGVLYVFGIVSINEQKKSNELTITFPIPKKKNMPFNQQSDAFEEQGTDYFSNKTDTIDAQVLHFFGKLKLSKSDDIEEIFTRFLIQKYNADGKTINLMIRKCFWKNFYTLQTPLDSFSSLSSFKSDFLMEKKLKIAGFNAMGLSLMEEELSKADNQFKFLQKMMSQETNGRNAL